MLEGLRWNASIQHLDLSYNDLGLAGLASVSIILINLVLFLVVLL